jgi:hypothetical protein
MTTALMPAARQQYFDNNGRPLTGGKLYTFGAGTSNPKATFTDAAGTVAQTNPIILNTRGEPDSPIYWDGAYRLELRDRFGNLVYSADNYNSDPMNLLGLLQAGGAAKVGYGNDTVGSVLDSLHLADYAALRAYTGKQKSVYITGYLVTTSPSGIAGVFVRDDTDNTTVDDGGVTIVAGNGVRWKRQVGQVVQAEWFGAVGNNIADNVVAFTALSNWVGNRPLLNAPVSVHFGPGIFLYTDGLRFTRPVYLFSNHQATLNYTGNSVALKLGPDGIANFDPFLQAECTVRGLRFTGGQNMVHGIYINEFVLEPRILDCIFIDFGNVNSYDIYGQFEDWNIIISGCRKLTVNSTTAVGNFIAIPGRKKDNSRYDGGNSRVSIIDCFMTSMAGQELGYFAYVNAVKARIIGGGFQHSTGGILLGGNATSTLIDGVYAELSTKNSPFYVQALSIDNGNGTYSSPQQVTIRNGYINMHQDVIAGAGKMIKAADANVKIRDWVIDGMTISNYAAGQVLIEQNNLAGQTGNQYGNIKRYYNPASADDGKRFILRGGYSLAERWVATDSEVGTWTPSLGGTATYTSQKGKFVRNGSVVTATFDIQVNAIGTGNTSQMYGLPYANGDSTCAGNIGFFNSLSTAVTALMARVDGAANWVQFNGLVAAATGVPGSLPVFGNATRIIGTVSYIADEPV